jgi:hypothetical protein
MARISINEFPIREIREIRGQQIFVKARGLCGSQRAAYELRFEKMAVRAKIRRANALNPYSCAASL